MIPLWFWPIFAVLLLLLMCHLELRQAERNRQNSRAINAERVAREAAKPLGNADRFYG